MNQRNISAFEFGQFIAKTAQAKVAQDLDNELSPDALANMAQTSALLKAKNPALGAKRPVMVQMPAKKPEAPLPPQKTAPNAVVRSQLPPVSSDPAKRDYIGEYNAWRASQGLTSGGPDGTIPGVPLQQLGGGDTSVKLPSGIR